MILIHPSIDPVIFSFGFIQIRWYSLAYILGFIIGLLLIKLINSQNINKIKNSIIDDLLVWSIFGVILGGRLGYVIFYQTEIIFTNPVEIFYIWKGGMSFHGGLIGIILSTIFFSKRNSINFFQLSDLISIVSPVGLFFGRIANFINVELYGKVTSFPFAMIYPTIDKFPRHPSQLYEALFEGVILFIILIYYNKKYLNEKSFGKITGIFFIYYGIIRFLIEFIREPDVHIGLFYNVLSMGQILSLPMIAIGIAIYKRKNIND